MKFFKKAVAAFLAALLLTLAGCAGGDTSWVFRSGDIVIPAGVYIAYQVNAYSQAGAKIAEENKDNADFVAPKSAAIPKATIEGQKGGDWINAKAQEAAREHIAVAQKFASLGMQLSEADISYIEGSISASKQQESGFYEKNGISDESLREFFTGMIEKRELFLKLYGEGGEFAVPQSEIDEYIQKTYALADVMLVSNPTEVPEGETRTLDELTAEAKAEAEAYLKRLQDGEAIEDLVYEQATKDATEEEKAQVQKAEKGELGIVVSENDRANYGDSFVDAVMAARPGASGIVEDTGIFIIYSIRDVMTDTAWLDESKNSVLAELKYDDFVEKLAGWGAAVQLETNAAAISRYKPQNIKFDDSEASSQ